MENLKECKKLASYVLFRELYDNGCNDLYDVVREFIKDVIISTNKYVYTLTEITSLVNNTFGFNIPELVIKTSIKRLENIKRENGKYILISEAEMDRNHLFNQSRCLEEQNIAIQNSLFFYVEKVNKKALTESEKSNLISSFCAFLLDDNNGYEDYELISAFVIENQNNAHFVKQLESIREGVLLYTGINNNNQANEIGHWNKEITIYLDMEILFYIAGYSGIIFKNLSDELLSLFQEVNIFKKKKIIKMQYFSETKTEIERFFDKAIFIIEGKDILSPNNIAMCSIIEGCKTPSDILDKKSDFYATLKNIGIHECEETNFYQECYDTYNLEDSSTLSAFSNEDDSENNYKHLKLISNINKLRNGKACNTFETSSFILLTNTTQTLKMSRSLSIENKTFSYATNMAFLTNLIWSKLNKGFGAKTFPKSIDIIIKSQIVLSKHISENISMKYKEVKDKYKRKEISDETIIARIAQLREQLRKPEDVYKEALEDALHSINEDNIFQFQEEHQLYKTKALEKDTENITLKNQITDYQKIIYSLVEKDKLKINLIKAKEESTTITKNKDNLIKQNDKINTKINIIKYSIKTFIGLVIVALFDFIIYLILKYGWNTLEQYTFILSLIPVLMSSILTIYGIKFRFKGFLSFIDDQIVMRCYKKDVSINVLIDEYKLAEIAMQEYILDIEDKLEKINKFCEESPELSF